MSLQFTHVRSFFCRDKLPNLRADGFTVGHFRVLITWQQILKCSLQVTTLGVLSHVTVERRHLGRYCREAVIADSAKQGRRKAVVLPL